jgi:hypothetical protein
MADFSGDARSNYFAVKDEAAFRALIAKTDLGIFEGTAENAGKLAVHASNADHGTWPSMYYDEEQEEEVTFDMVDLIQPHLADGEVVVLMEVGAEKMRYLGGWALAFDNTDREPVRVALDDIYELAARAFAVPGSKPISHAAH